MGDQTKQQLNKRLMDARPKIEHALKHPYDGIKGMPATVPLGWAHVAARGILADLTDRRGLDHEFNNIDEATRREIVEAMADIVLLAFMEYRGSPPIKTGIPA
jgi:hypothetical protein